MSPRVAMRFHGTVCRALLPSESAWVGRPAELQGGIHELGSN